MRKDEIKTVHFQGSYTSPLKNRINLMTENRKKNKKQSVSFHLFCM
uniref:Uncharacterized protein n=1 Tax=Heterorhabditis bacteriophora TaxID=37862 RepID=A0A1I7W637_HETBA